MDKKKTLITAAAITAAAVAVPAFLLAPGRAGKRSKAPFVGVNFAHRGLHSRDKSVPENSIEAFRLAARQGYGVELDVQLTKDGHVVVFHDATLDRVCGVEGRVDEFTYGELCKMRLCGTEYGIPLLSEVLAVIRGRGPIVLELKPGKRNKELCKKTVEILSAYRGNVCIESFHPAIVAWFRFNAPEFIRGQLAMPAKGYTEQPKAIAFILSNCLLNFLTRPHFIAYEIGKRPLSVKISQLLGAMPFCWTSHEPANEKKMDGVIFEFYKPRPKFK